MDFEQHPKDYRPGEFFQKYVSAFIPPYYALKASQLTDRTGRDFLRMWSWAFDELMRQTGTKAVVGNVDSYSADIRGNALPGATSRVSEVYKSSFVQTMEWFIKQNWIDSQVGSECALSICPVDLSIWEISSVDMPSWWPKAQGESHASEMATLGEWKACEQLLNIRESDNTLFAAQGAIPDALEKARIWFQLLPFAYEVRGANLPAAADVAKSLSKAFWQKYPTGPEPLSILSPSFEGWIPFFCEPGAVNDLYIVPLLSHLECNNINVWLSWRGANRPFFAAPNVIRGGSPGFDATSWFYKVDEMIAIQVRDWRIGTLEFMNSHQYMMHGQFAFANRDWLSSTLDELGFRLGHVLSIHMKESKSEYSKPEVVRFAKLINVSRLVV